MSSLGQLLTEQNNPASQGIDRLDTAGMLRVMNAEDQKVAPAVAEAVPSIARALDAIVERVRAGGCLFYIGAGTSGRLGVLDASECPPTFNVPPEMVQGIIAGGEPALSRATEASEDDPDRGAKDLIARGFCGKDCLVGIAASGRTPYVLGAVRAARALGAVTAGISCTPAALLSSQVEFPIEVLVGPEVLAGSTRLKAGTATKLVLNMISTGLMIQLGYTFGNVMVNVQPKNVKLVDRAQRIIAATAGVSYEEASMWLERSGRNVRVAIVMARTGCSRDEAEARLAAAGGRVHRAIESHG